MDMYKLSTPMRERAACLIAIGCVSVLMIVISHFKAGKAAHFGGDHFTSSSSLQTTSTRIFCYGDSLTAGISPPLFQEFPYAPHLELALQQLNHNVIVRHEGLPGWTSWQMLDEIDNQLGLRTELKVASPIQVAILLVGTNDLALADPEPIIENIISLHRLTHAEGVPHTIAIGIPPSGYQSFEPIAAQKAQAVNDALQNYCQHDQRVHYFPFPFPFVQGDDKWAPDGLHFSPKGYQVLAEALVPIISAILNLYQ